MTSYFFMLYKSKTLFIKSFDCLNLAILIVLQLADFQASQPCFVIRWNAIVMEQIPLAFVLGNGVVSCPTNNRGKNHTLISERSIRIVTDCIAKEVAVAS